ncbi:MAG: SDR family NAD(P)-dependent oxidoreductase [Proteobacteria bacterium]|nr:SDR family NAD(P)-dependent oxidoreductase [Pseudomonadota bacterium]
MSLALTHVLVTGAGGAIGGALARAMAARWPAARLALLDRAPGSMATLADELGARATTHAVDLCDVDALPAVVDAISAVAPLDGLVNCAGIIAVQSLPTWQWAAARDLIAIDLLAPLRLQPLVAQQLVERGAPGLIVNISSMAGKVPLKGCAYYGASKAGLAMASEIAHAELAPHGIRVVTVYPGPVTSPVEQGMRDAYGGGGALGKYAPTGAPGALATRIVRAIDQHEPRVVYPRAYELGFTAPNLSRWLALSLGPDPRS